MYIKRHLETTIEKLNSCFKVLLLTGPRQVGKTTLLRRIAAADRTYVTMDDISVRSLAMTEPTLFLQGVSESLTGRIGIVNLLGVSHGELIERPAGPFVPENEFLLRRVKESPLLQMSDLFDQIWQGSMPALNSASEQDWNCYYSSYVQTFLQRDVKELAQVNDELLFYRFLCAAASYTGSMLNYAALAKEAEITPPTAKQWLKVLAASGLVYFLEPFAHPNLKYAVKAPKLYFTDTGLAAYLLRWSSAATLEAGAMASNFFETWVVNEIYKSFINCGQIPPLSYFRDFNTKEVELLIETDGCVYPLAIRKSAQPVKEIKKFEILKPVAEGEKALRIGSGGVVCLANDLLPVDAKNWYIPVGLL